jgi:murein DD-endopeptidase MepM/ murein hydrolase activator NlpD
MYDSLAVGRILISVVMDKKPQKGNSVRYIRYAGLILLLMLAACEKSESQPAPEVLRVTASPFVTKAAPTIVPRKLLSTPTRELNFTPTPRPELLIPTQTSQPTFQACPPLKDHSWKDLKEIVTNPFDPPPAGKDTGHQGVDFAYYRRGNRLSIEGVPVDSVFSGQTAAVIHNRPPYGNMVIIETPAARLPAALITFLGIDSGESAYLLYAHMKTDPLVELGQEVDCGENLGDVGNTPPGWSSAPHLHLEVRIGPSGAEFTGMAYYDNSITLVEKGNYELWRMSGTFRMLDPLKMLEFVLNHQG